MKQTHLTQYLFIFTNNLRYGNVFIMLPALGTYWRINLSQIKGDVKVVPSISKDSNCDYLRCFVLRNDFWCFQNLLLYTVEGPMFVYNGIDS